MPTEQKTIRKLRAILSADVKGYSLLMADDEAFTIQTLKEYRGIMSTHIEQYNGRVVDFPGDNMLAEFSSAVDAVECAVDIQKHLKKENDRFAEDKRLQFRIGVNIGDIVQDGDRIYGSGVNVAARIEGLAEPGGICISRNAYDHIKDKLNFGYEYLGDHEVKNIKDPVRVYKVLMDPEDAGKLIGEKPKPSARKWVWPAVVAATIVLTLIGYQFYQKLSAPEFEPAAIERMAYQLPDKPSIAVLAFDNLSGDPEQEYFSDGISEEIITCLSKTDKLFVIARNSTFTYKGKPVNVKQVAEELGVRYVLEGSVRKSEDRVRITAQLIDAISGHHLWAERYDRDLKDIFALQDEITIKIVTALQVNLTEGDQARWFAKQYENLDVKLKALELRSLWRKGTVESLIRYGQIAQEIVDMAPESPIGYGYLGWHYWNLAMQGKSPRESIAKAFKLAQKALSIDESDAFSHHLLGNVYLMMRQYQKAIAAGKRAIELAPNAAIVHGGLGNTLSYAGRPDEAIGYLNKGIRLNPFPPYWIFVHLSRCYTLKGQYEDALTTTKKALQRSPDASFPHIYLAISYALLDRKEEAGVAAKKVLEIDPSFSVERVSKTSPFKNKADLKLIIDAMRKAGLPDKPPIPLPDKPSIAVLPFDNLSNDPEQEYFSDGITEDIITALSKTPKMLVIARHSTFTYKGKQVKVQEVGRDLGVRYVLEGSVRKVGEKVRITAQLIDAKTGHHLWAEKYDRELGDIFAVQDEITKEVILALHIKLTHGEQARIYSKGTDNIDAYLMAMQAQWYSYLWSKNRNLEARRLAEKAIVLAPDYAYAYRILGLTHVVDLFVGLSQSPKKSLRLAMDAYKKAISLDKSLASAYLGKGLVLTMLRKHDEAVSIGKKAIELEPNSADVLQGYAAILTYAGIVGEAIPLFREVRRLNPIPSNSYYHWFGHALRLSGKYEEAIALQRKAIKQEPDSHASYIILGYSAIFAGRDEEAQAAVKEILRIKPNFSAADLIAPFKDRTILVENCEALNKAGLSLNCDILHKAASK